MAVISNREAYLASEPEMDITQFHKTALDLKYADESENQILDIFYPEDGEGPYPLVINTSRPKPPWVTPPACVTCRLRMAQLIC